MNLNQIQKIWENAYMDAIGCGESLEFAEEYATKKVAPFRDAWIQEGKDKDAYYALQDELIEIEQATGLYLADTNIDQEDVHPLREGDQGFWDKMLFTAKFSAGIRAEEAGMDINVLIGRVIY